MASPCLRQGHTMKQRHNEVAVNDSPQCAGSWPWGGARRRWRARALCRRVGVGGGASHRRTGNPLLSFLQLRFVLFTRRKEKKKKKRKRKKKKFSFIWWDTHVNATFRRYPCRFCLFFSRLRPRVAVARVTHKCVLVPVCFLGYFTKLVGTVVSSKKKKKREREKEGD